MKTNQYTLLAAGLVVSCVTGWAQQDETRHDWGGFDTGGSTTVGYRFDSVTGRQQKFDELFNLQSGFRLFDFHLDGRAKTPATKFADSYYLDASGLGGDPFPAGQFGIRKAKVFDFRANFRQSYYAFDRDDSAVLPSGFNGLTTNHNWSTVRKLGSVNLLVHATNKLKFRAEYGRNSRSGVNFTTRTMEYFGAPSAWGGFVRDSPYYVEAPMDDGLNRFAGGLDYTLARWTFHYTLGYQRFNQSMNWNNVIPFERSINVDSATSQKEYINVSTWNESRKLSTPSSEFNYNGSVTDRLTLRGNFLYYRYQGPASMTAVFNGVARTTGTNVGPFDVSMNSKAQLTEPNYIVDQGFTYRITDWWNWHTDYRFNRFTQQATADVNSVRDKVTPFSETVHDDWANSLQQLDIAMELTPIKKLVLRPGIRLVKRDTIAFEDHIADPARTQRAKSVWPLVSIAYLPSDKLSVRFDLQSNTTNNTYTRITPHTDVGTRLVVRYRPFRKLTIEDNNIVRNRTNAAADFYNRVRSNGATVSWAFSDRFSGFGGFSYDSFLATASVTFLRGTAPLTTQWRDQTVNRVWQLGITAKPTKRLGVDFSGNFVRTTGVGEITGEPANFGPLTFPMATGTVHYDLPRVGRLAVDLQRTYYIEQIVRANNFQANLLTIRWTRGF